MCALIFYIIFGGRFPHIYAFNTSLVFTCNLPTHIGKTKYSLGYRRSQLSRHFPLFTCIEIEVVGASFLSQLQTDISWSWNNSRPIVEAPATRRYKQATSKRSEISAQHILTHVKAFMKSSIVFYMARSGRPRPRTGGRCLRTDDETHRNRQLPKQSAYRQTPVVQTTGNPTPKKASQISPPPKDINGQPATTKTYAETIGTPAPRGLPVSYRPAQMQEKRKPTWTSRVFVRLPEDSPLQAAHPLYIGSKNGWWLKRYMNLNWMHWSLEVNLTGKTAIFLAFFWLMRWEKEATNKQFSVDLRSPVFTHGQLNCTRYRCWWEGCFLGKFKKMKADMIKKTPTNWWATTYILEY